MLFIFLKKEWSHSLGVLCKLGVTAIGPGNVIYYKHTFWVVIPADKGLVLWEVFLFSFVWRNRMPEFWLKDPFLLLSVCILRLIISSDQDLLGGTSAHFNKRLDCWIQSLYFSLGWYDIFSAKWSLQIRISHCENFPFSLF